jgi:hypothetical protein
LKVFAIPVSDKLIKYILRLHYLLVCVQRINFLKQQLAEYGDNKRNFPTLPIDGTIDGLKGMMLDNKYLYEKCREDGVSPGSLVQLKIHHSSNNGNYTQSYKLLYLT